MPLIKGFGGFLTVDYLTPSLQADALGVAMSSIAPPVMCLAGISFYMASRYLRADLERAPK